MPKRKRKSKKSSPTSSSSSSGSSSDSSDSEHEKQTSNIVENNISVCKDCSIKIKFLYSGIELKCIYCQFFLDYEYAYICQKCSKKNF